MKLRLLLILSLVSSIASAGLQRFDAVKIGGKATMDTHALLDMTSTSLGALLPRMTSIQRLAINSPPDGLLVFDTNLETILVYNATLAGWTFLVAASGGGA